MSGLEKEFEEWFKINEKRLFKKYKVYLKEISDSEVKSFKEWVWDYYESFWE